MWFDPAKLPKKEHYPPANFANSANSAGDSMGSGSEISGISEISNGVESEIQPNDTRKFCRQCHHHRSVYGRGEVVIRCTKQKQVWLDEWPRHCKDFDANGGVMPTVGVRWQPESAELAAEAANDSVDKLTCQQTQTIARWVNSLGGSSETISV